MGTSDSPEKASKNTIVEHPFLTYVSKQSINDLPLVQFSGKIHLITKQNQVDAALDCLYKETVLGFDTETRPSFKKGQYFPVSLLQLATPEEVFLFRLNQIHLPAPLISLLANNKVVKLGIAVHDDIKALQKLENFIPANILEFSKITKELGISNSGLRSLAAILLKERVSKGARLTNWQNPTLTSSQQIYAATDAWICLKMYQRLLQEGFSPNFLIGPHLT